MARDGDGKCLETRWKRATEDLYLLVFRAISREETRKDRGRVGGRSTLGHSSTGWTKEGTDREREREKDRGEEVEKAVEPCWKLLKSTRARDGSGSGGRNEEGKKGADRISETWNQWLSVTVLSYENLSSDPIVGARGCGIKLIKDSARNPHSMN